MTTMPEWSKGMVLTGQRLAQELCRDLWILGLIGLDHSVITLKKKIKTQFWRHLRKTSWVQIPLVVSKVLERGNRSQNALRSS